MPQDTPQKILAIHFRYLGDSALLVPALRAIHERYPGCALRVLVPEETGPLLRHLPWLTLWVMWRKRGKARFRKTWPVMRALRAERFDRSADFNGIDRTAITPARAWVSLQRLANGGFVAETKFI